MNHKITILGCGISGMIAALSLAANNIKSTILEHRSSSNKIFFEDIRTTALTNSSVKFFEQIGIWQELSQIAGNINDIYVVDNKLDEMLHFEAPWSSSKEIMGYLVKNTDFKKILFNLVSKNELINLIDNCPYEVSENTEEHVNVILNNKVLHKSNLLLVCDGRNSNTKHLYFSNKFEKNYKQSAYTFLVRHDKPHEGTAVEHFMNSGPFAILPLKDQNLSSVVWTVDLELKKVLDTISKPEFLDIVKYNFGEFLGNINIDSKVVSFPLKAFETNKYYNKNIVLLGDTAHVIHPLAGQGLNQGIKDIDCLVSLIIEYGVSEIMLKEYEQKRKFDNRVMLEITDTINSIFSNDSNILRTARQIGFKVINELPFLKNSIIKYAMGKR